MSDPRTDKLLREFLEKEAEARANGVTLESVHRTLLRIAKDRLKDRITVATHGKAIKTLQHQVAMLTAATPAVPAWHAPHDEITGTHQVEALKRAQADLEERLDEKEEHERDEATWWARQIRLWVVAGVGALLLVGIGGCVTYTLNEVMGLKKQLSEQKRAP